MSGSQRLRFLEFELDLGVPELRKSGAPIRIQQKPLDLLAYLAANQHRVVAKEELLERVWHGAAVSADALTSALRDLRRALGDTVSPHRLIVTVRARGYRLAADVHGDTAACEQKTAAEPPPGEISAQPPSDVTQRRRVQQAPLSVLPLVVQLTRAALSRTGHEKDSRNAEIVDSVAIVIVVGCQLRARFRSVGAEGARAVSARVRPRSRRRRVRS